MPRGRVAGIRSVGARDTAQEDERTDLPTKRRDNEFVYRSRHASYRLGLTKRVVRFTSDGERFEEPRTSKQGNPLDEVKFEDHTFRTTDPEVAALMAAKEGYGLGRDFWSLDEQKAEMDKAQETEFRRMVESRPDLVKKVLKPSDKDDFEMPEAPA